MLAIPFQLLRQGQSSGRSFRSLALGPLCFEASRNLGTLGIRKPTSFRHRLVTLAGHSLTVEQSAKLRLFRLNVLREGSCPLQSYHTQIWIEGNLHV